MKVQKGGKLQCWTRKNNRLENYVVCKDTKQKKTRKKRKNKISKKKIQNEKTPEVSQDDILKMVKNYPDLGFKSDDWMTDPCHVLLNMKRKLKTKIWSNSILKSLDDTIPLIERTPDMIRYGNYSISYREHLGSGSYGDVYSAIMTDIKSNKKKKIVIKDVLTSDPLEFFSESILQLELFCGMRGKFGFGARIPKIEFISKYKSRTTGKYKYVVGMEPLDGDGWNFFDSGKFKDIEKIKGIKSISELLIKLQKNFGFMHRDLHLGNIMYKNVSAPGNPPRYRFYIIDFGFSTAMFCGFRINKNNNMYDYYFLNKTHDLRMLFVSMFRNTTRLVTDYKFYMRFVIIRLLRSITFYFKVDDNPFFWDTYGQLVKYYDETFLPENIIVLCDYLIGKGEGLLNQKKLNVRLYNNLTNKMDEIVPYPDDPRSTVIKKWNNTQKKLETMNIRNEKKSRLKESINIAFNSLKRNCLTY